MTESSTPSFSFNLWHKPWIRATRHGDGQSTTLGIGACLAQAHTLAALHDPSPLVVGGIHRLLTAIVQAIYAPQSLREIAAVFRSGQFNAASLDAFATQHVERFDLFHPTAPFLQTGDVPLDKWKSIKPNDRQSVAKLFPELPSGENITHFQHSIEASHRFCPACCARGLVRIPAFALAEGGGTEGYKPCINGKSPLYVLPAGDNLFQSLALSLTSPEFQPKQADPSRDHINAWSGDTTIPRKHEISSPGYLESLTFPTRKIRLYPRNEATYCTQCGEHSTTTVRDVYFKMGMSRTKGSKTWDDPFVAFHKTPDDLVPVIMEPGKALWREYSTLLLANRDDPELLPKIVRQLGLLIQDYQVGSTDVVRVRCLGIRIDKQKVAKIHEWLDEALDAPPALLNDPKGALLVDEALQRADDVASVMASVFDIYFRPERTKEGDKKNQRPNQKTVRFKTLRERMHTMFWEQLAPKFRQLINHAADPAQHPALERQWIETLMHVGLDTFNTAAEQAGEGADALRMRVEAQNRCRLELNKKRKEW